MLSSSESASIHFSSSQRLEIDYLLDPKAIEQDDIQDAISGLRQVPKSLPARYFYDQKGSQLFEQICELPEYYPTRTEAGILQQYGTEIIERTQAVELVELGSGSSTKTRYLFNAYRSQDSALYYVPVDVSDSILQTSAKNLLADYPQLKIQGKVATYSQALEQLAHSNIGKRMIIFLGSSIGNFNSQECDRLMQQVTSALHPGDYFLLGIDLQKPQAILEAAYNDAQGITAAFNLNMLQHLNNRFGGNFDLQQFKHQAIYNSTAHQIEMYLISQVEQTVTLANINLTIDLEQGEKILTEISRKFDAEKMAKYLSSSQYGLNLIKNYTDTEQKFSLLLCQLN
ncbi:MAG: L-histidine N(alpha)-methyltransferase [Cyanobacteria bacterium P01_C01_bin.72]